MAEKEQPKQEEVVEEKKAEPEPKIEEAPRFQLQVVSESHVLYDEYCGFGAHEGGNTWIRLVGPDNSAQSWGYFPGSQTDVPAGPTTGNVLDPSHTGYQPDQVRTFELDQEKATAVIARAEQKRTQPGEYDVLGNNCATFVQDVALAGGVPVSLEEILLPNQKAVLLHMAQLRVQSAAGKEVEAESEEQ